MPVLGGQLARRAIDAVGVETRDMNGYTHSFLVKVAALLAVLSCGPAAQGGALLSIESVNSHATIALSCGPAKKLGLIVTGRPTGPIIKPVDPATGLARRGTVRYTFDGQMPITEQWLPSDDGSMPSDAAQLRAFAQRLFLGHVLHISLDGWASFEFQLDGYVSQLADFARTCVAPR